MKSSPKSFAVFILTHGRPDRVITYNTLRRSGYTGPIYFIVDDTDKTVDQYRATYGKQVIVFGKKTIGKKFDQGDNTGDMRSITWARNASFEIAQKLKVKYFIQLDDDYTNFSFRFNERLRYLPANVTIKNMDAVFNSLLKFYISSGVTSLAIAQGGDFIGGHAGPAAEAPMLKRKCMNSFICSTDRPFKFLGRFNEDVNTYTTLGSRGHLMVTATQVSLVQKATQSQSGGITEAYLEYGTYVKSFFTVMYQPSSVKVKIMQSKNPRLHHAVSWKNAVPMIISEDHRKPDHATKLRKAKK